MRVIERFPSRAIERFGSTGFEPARIAQGDVQVSVAELDGTIGGHEAASQQLLVVLRGRVSVATRDDGSELGPGAGAVWHEGEWHETRSLEPSLIALVEGTFEVLVG